MSTTPQPPFVMPDPYRIGIVYANSMGTTHVVEANFRPVGKTSYDKSVGCCVYWFKNLKEWELQRRAVFEQMGNSLNPPIPIIQMIPQAERDYDALLGILDKKGDKEFLRCVSDWGSARQNFLENIHEIGLSTLEGHYTKVLDGYNLAKEGGKLPPDADVFTRCGFENWKAPKVEQTTTTTTSAPIVTTTTEAPIPTTTTPPPADLSGNETKTAENGTVVAQNTELADKIVQQHGGRSIRLKDLADEMALKVEEIRPVIEADPRFQPIPANGWVRLKTQPQQQ